MYKVKREGQYPLETEDDEIIAHQRRRKVKRERDYENHDGEVNVFQPKKKPKTTVSPMVKKKTTDNASATAACYYNDEEIVVNSNAPCTSAISNDTMVSNIIVSSAFGINLYLEAPTVMRYCLYWLSQYSNSTIKQEFWFYEMITTLIDNPVGIELISDIGFPAITDTLLRYRYLFSFMGSDMNRVPTVIFESQKNDAFFYALSYFEDPDNKCFLEANNGGLRGEISLSRFNYNHILDHFFEPSFIIITCFAIAVPYLIHASIRNIIRPKKPQTHKKKTYIQLKSELYHQFVPTIDKMIQSVAMNGDAFRCLNKANPFYESNLLRFKHDLIRLKTIMEGFINDVYKTKEELLQLWSEKATFCSLLKKERLEYVINKYCSV
jgi:hypothetical protein